MSPADSPDCAAEKHGACSGTSWDHEREEIVPCPCGCHAQHGSLAGAKARAFLGPRIVPLTPEEES